MLNLNEEVPGYLFAAFGGDTEREAEELHLAAANVRGQRRTISARGTHRQTRRPARADEPGQSDRERHGALAELPMVRATDRVADDGVDRAEAGGDAVNCVEAPSPKRAVK